MEMTPNRMRRTVALFLFIAAGAVLTFSPSADASPCDEGRYTEGCIALYGDDREDSSNNSSTSATPTPTPTPTNPPPDYPKMHADALAAALALIEPELEVAPGWQSWPTRELLVVNLETFFFINENWEPKDVSVTATDPYDSSAYVTVTVTADPKWSHWTLTEATTGTAHHFTCKGQGSEWTHGATQAECGWTAESSEPVTGLLSPHVVIEYELSWYSTYLGESGPIDTRFGCPNTDGQLHVREVQSFGITAASSPTGATASGPTGSVGAPSCGENEGGDDDNDSMFSTEHPRGEEVLGHHIVCPATAGASVAGFDVGGGQETDIEQYIYQDEYGEWHLGSTVISIAAEGTIGKSVDTTKAWFPDNALGTYFGASASAALTVSLSNQWVIDADQDAHEALDIIHNDTTLGLIDEAANGLGLTDIDQAPEVYSWTVGAEVSGAAGLAAGAGIDLDGLNLGVALGAEVEASASIAYRNYADGREGIIVTAGGSVTGEARGEITLQLLEAAGFDLSEYGNAEDLVGDATTADLLGFDLASVEILANYQIEYIWEGDELVEAVINTTYGWDADFLGDEDGLVVTKQTTTLDLTDDDVLADFENSFYTGIDGDGHIEGDSNGPIKYTVENEVGGVDWGNSLLGLETEWGCYIEMIGFYDDGHNHELWNS